MSHVFEGYQRYKGDIERRNTGSLVSFETGEAVTYGLYNAQERGQLFIPAGTPVYEGMIVGASPKTEDLVEIMFKGLDRRLAEFLLAEAERTGSDTIRMTHEQIAQHISSAREAVARMLKGFSEDGLVELRRGAITLRDKNRLNRLK